MITKLVTSDVVAICTILGFMLGPWLGTITLTVVMAWMVVYRPKALGRALRSGPHDPPEGLKA